MPVKRSDEGGVVWLTFDRPDRLNALDEPMRHEFIAHLRDIRADEGPRCLVLTGAGGAFCSGADVKNMGGATPRDFRGQRHVIRHNAHNYLSLLADLDIPVIAAVDGHAAGVGWSIALACDAIIAADSARFTAAFGRIGLAPDGGLVWHLARACGQYAAKDIILGARTVTADRALELGLVTQVVPAADLTATSRTLADEYARGPTFAMALAKRQFQLAMGPSLGSFFEHEALMQPALHSTADFREGTAAFKEKRRPRFSGR